MEGRKMGVKVMLPALLQESAAQTPPMPFIFLPSIFLP